MTDNAVKIAIRERPIRKNKNKPDISVISYRNVGSCNILLVDERPFAFDHVLGPIVTQEKLYNELITPLIEKVGQGFNCTAMAYGQTGTGKSYTMGLDTNNFDSENVGIIPRCLKDILNMAQTENDVVTEIKTKVSVSFVEIYNEKVFDLLGDNLTDPIVSRGLKITIGSRKPVTTIKQCLDILTQGTKNRHVRPTKMNSQSSRSHAIFTIYLKSENDGKILNSCLNLVDLAGSEGVRRTGHQGIALSEGVHINQGLLCIGKVLQAMIQGNKIIPYRDSVLSSVLQDSLSPNSYLTLLACVSPQKEDLSETLSTLRFAQNAKQLKSSPHVNAVIAEIKKSKTKTPFKQISKPETTKIPLKSSNMPGKMYMPYSINKSTKVYVIDNPINSGIKRIAVHGNTFSTPNKNKNPGAFKLNESEIGFTTKEMNKKILNRLEPIESSFNVPPPESCFESLNTSIDSQGSLNLDVSTSTVLDAIEKPKPPPSSDSPLVRKMVAACESMMDTKIEKIFSAFKNKENISAVKSLHETNAPIDFENATDIWTGSIRKEIHSVLSDFIKSKSKANTSNISLYNDSSLSIDPNTTCQQLFSKTNPVFKVPELPISKNNNDSIRRSLRISEQKALRDQMNDSNISETSFNRSHSRSQSLIKMYKDRKNSIRQANNSAEKKIRRNSMSKNHSKSIKTVDDKNIKSTVNKNITSHYFDAHNDIKSKTPSNKNLIKHRKAILDLLNSGSIKQIQVLPQIGQKTAYHIVTHRTLYGKFKNINQVEKLPIWRGKAFERFAEANILSFR